MSGHADTIRWTRAEYRAEVARLLAENQRLKLAKANAEIALMQQLETNTRRTGELVDVLAENQRLREALEEIASGVYVAQGQPAAAYMQKVAREALAGDGE